MFSDHQNLGQVKFSNLLLLGFIQTNQESPSSRASWELKIWVLSPRRENRNISFLWNGNISPSVHFDLIRNDICIYYIAFEKKEFVLLMQNILTASEWNVSINFHWKFQQKDHAPASPSCWAALCPGKLFGQTVLLSTDFQVRSLLWLLTKHLNPLQVRDHLLLMIKNAFGCSVTHNL